MGLVTLGILLYPKLVSSSLAWATLQVTGRFRAVEKDRGLFCTTLSPTWVHYRQQSAQPLEEGSTKRILSWFRVIGYIAFLEIAAKVHCGILYFPTFQNRAELFFFQISYEMDVTFIPWRSTSLIEKVSQNQDVWYMKLTSYMDIQWYKLDQSYWG